MDLRERAPIWVVTRRDAASYLNFKQDLLAHQGALYNSVT